jgi:hypothetical protein
MAGSRLLHPIESEKTQPRLELRIRQGQQQQWEAPALPLDFPCGTGLTIRVALLPGRVISRAEFVSDDNDSKKTVIIAREWTTRGIQLTLPPASIWVSLGKG